MEIIRINRARLVERLVDNQPENVIGARGSEMGILQGEFARKRGHMPVRKLIKKTGSPIQRIEPFFMMSPISIAQYLDPTAAQFDVIIFDEASQVHPHDSFGALLRGRQLVVMGDSKQLPPTIFFQTLADTSDTDEEEASISDTESLLGMCRMSFPSKTLKWHYRSRHESLIAVSNHQFYDDDLLVYPSPMHEHDDYGLKFVSTEGTIYERGRSSSNKGEARIVAEAVMEHYLNNPGLSLAVATFSQKQKETIDLEIERLRRANPDFDRALSSNIEERFDVKNLETIQGDEHDVIYISMGYGFDANGKLSMNFGPLNKQGGERGLNVLITRARQKCVVFSNFTAGDMRLTDSTGDGVKGLKTFLEYAETGQMPSVKTVGGEFESPFEESVYEFLRSQGYTVHDQVGCSGYWIDLAIVSPTEPGRYVLGIECDGAQYHSSRSARGRDRLRQQVLEGQRWRSHRVWAPSCYNDRFATQRELIDAVEVACGPRIEPSVPNVDEGTAFHEEVEISDDERFQAKRVAELLPDYAVAGNA